MVRMYNSLFNIRSHKLKQSVQSTSSLSAVLVVALS